MNKKDFIYGTIILVLVIFSATLLIKNDKDDIATNIFNSAAESIVEVKATTQSVGESFGSGVIYDSSGFLITNAHVVTYRKLGEVELFENYYIRLINAEDFAEVKLIKYDLDLDLAILEIIDKSIILNEVKFSNDSLNYGQKVYAIGNTSNYGIGISEGIISVPLVNVVYDELERQVIQVDISISTGNSGGSILNNKGELIGITTFRTKDINGNVNYGFAYCIPINIINEYIGEEKE